MPQKQRSVPFRSGHFQIGTSSRPVPQNSELVPERRNAERVPVQHWFFLITSTFKTAVVAVGIKLLIGRIMRNVCKL